MNKVKMQTICKIDRKIQNVRQVGDRLICNPTPLWLIKLSETMVKIRKITQIEIQSSFGPNFIVKADLKKPAECKFCRASIRWAKNVSGDAVAIEYSPSKKGWIYHFPCS